MIDFDYSGSTSWWVGVNSRLTLTFKDTSSNGAYRKLLSNRFLTSVALLSSSGK